MWMELAINKKTNDDEVDKHAIFYLEDIAISNH